MKNIGEGCEKLAVMKTKNDSRNLARPLEVFDDFNVMGLCSKARWD